MRGRKERAFTRDAVAGRRHAALVCHVVDHEVQARLHVNVAGSRRREIMGSASILFIQSDPFKNGLSGPRSKGARVGVGRPFATLSGEGPFCLKTGS